MTREKIEELLGLLRAIGRPSNSVSRAIAEVVGTFFDGDLPVTHPDYTGSVAAAKTLIPLFHEYHITQCIRAPRVYPDRCIVSIFPPTHAPSSVPPVTHQIEAVAVCIAALEAWLRRITQSPADALLHYIKYLFPNTRDQALVLSWMAYQVQTGQPVMWGLRINSPPGEGMAAFYAALFSVLPNLRGMVLSAQHVILSDGQLPTRNALLYEPVIQRGEGVPAKDFITEDLRAALMGYTLHPAFNPFSPP